MFEIQSCRICLKTELTLLETSTKNNADITYLEQLIYCVPEIVEGIDSLPSMICSTCSEMLETVANFKKLCIASYETRKQYLRSKSKKVDGNKSHYVCEICCGEFKNRGILTRHVNRHNGTRNYICSTCGKRFFSNSDLNHHNQRHLNEQAYKCNDCDKTFNTASNLRTHSIVHSALRRYRCTICSKKCVSRTTLNVHLKRHGNERDFACHLCSNKRFVTKSELTRHVRSHSNVRLFKCVSCPAEYKSGAVLNRHVKMNHLTVPKK